MGERVLSHPAAMTICGGCCFAEPLGRDGSLTDFTIGCVAPIQGEMVSQRPRYIGEASESEEQPATIQVDPDQVVITVRFIPEQGAECILYAGGKDVRGGRCNRKRAAERVEHKKFEYTMDKKLVDDPEALRQVLRVQY